VRQFYLGEHKVDHAVDEVVLVREVVVESHRFDAKLLAQLAHGKGVDAAFICLADGNLQHPPAGQRCAAPRPRFGLRAHKAPS